MQEVSEGSNSGGTWLSWMNGSWTQGATSDMDWNETSHKEL